MQLSLFIAKKIRKKGHRSGNSSGLGTIIATLSVAISVAVMVGAMAIAKGFQHEIKEQIHGFTGEVMLMAPGQDMVRIQRPIPTNISYREALLALPGIQSVEQVAYLPGMVRNDEGEVLGLVFKGIDSLYTTDFFADHLVAGRLPDYRSSKTSNEILLSKRNADRLHLQVGDPMTVYFVGDRIRVRKFQVVGLYALGMAEFDEMFALVDLRQIQRLKGWKTDEVAALELHWAAGTDYEQAVPALDHILMEEAQDDDPTLIPQYISRNYQHIYDWLELLDMNVLILLILMVVVAGFNMVSGLLILLFEKIQMIGLLKALGMRTGQICRIFVIRGMSIVAVGMGIGNLIAGLFCWTQAKWEWFSLDPNNYFVDHVPIHLPFLSWLGVNLFAMLAIFLILWLPTLFIGRISPARTLKAD